MFGNAAETKHNFILKFKVPLLFHNFFQQWQVIYWPYAKLSKEVVNTNRYEDFTYSLKGKEHLFLLTDYSRRYSYPETLNVVLAFQFHVVQKVIDVPKTKFYFSLNQSSPIERIAIYK